MLGDARQIIQIYIIYKLFPIMLMFTNVFCMCQLLNIGKQLQNYSWVGFTSV